MDDTSRLWLIPCDEQGNRINKSLPPGMLNYINVAYTQHLPRIGEELYITLNIEPGGDNDGEARFIVRSIEHHVDQLRESNRQKSNLSGRIDMYIERIDH